VELRDTSEAQNASSSTTVARQAAFLLNDGKIVGLDGSSNLTFNQTIEDSLFVVIWHRNHLGILSAIALYEYGGVYSYDFTTASGKTYGGAIGCKELSVATWGMISGDGDASNQVNNSDKNDLWAQQAGNAGYIAGDFSLDSEVDNQDKNDLWVPNSGKGLRYSRFENVHLQK